MTDLTRFTFSKAALAWRCGYWMRPDATLWRSEADNEYTQGGRLVHAALAALANAPLPPPAHERDRRPVSRFAAAKVPALEDEELRALFSRGKAWLEESWRPGMRAEIAFAYDVATGLARELVDPAGEEGTRWYADPAKRAAYAGPGGAIRATEICGRVDLCGMGVDALGAFAQVDDYKCHWAPDWVDARAQLQVSALAVAGAWGVDRVKMRGVHLWADADVHEELYELGPEELRDLAADLRMLLDAPANDPQVDGAWCKSRRCDARAACPATQEKVEEALALIPADRLARTGRRFGAPITSNEEGAQALVAIDLLEQALSAELARARAWADQTGGIVDDEGKRYSGQDQVAERPDLMVPGAIDVLEAHALDFAITLTTSWTAMLDASDKETVAIAREKLTAIGAVKATPKRVYMARKIEGLAKARRPKAKDERQAS